MNTRLQITPIQYLKTLFGEPLGPGRLVLWTRSNRGVGCWAYWPDNLDEAARLICEHRQSRDVYVEITLQDHIRALELARRRRSRVTERQVVGSEASATLLPALYIDLDFAAPGRRRSDLPPRPEAALGLLRKVEWPPSLVIRSGRGFHVYWLLREPLVLNTPEARLKARGLVSKLQAPIVAAAAEQGWDLAQSADLGRLVRVPGTFNHQLKPRVEVTVELFQPLLGEPERRYAPEDFGGLPEPEAADGFGVLMRDSGTHPGGVRNVDLRPVVGGCRFLRYAYDRRGSLPEAEWQEALSIVTRCRVGSVDGRRLGHRYSRDHPGYTLDGTDARIEWSWTVRGPATCGRIEGLSAEAAACCAGCVHRGRIDGPIDLGLDGAASGHPACVESEGQAGGLPILIPEVRPSGPRALALGAPEPDCLRQGGVLVQLVPPGARSIAGDDSSSASLPDVVWIGWPQRRPEAATGESAAVAGAVSDDVLGDLVGGLSELLGRLGGVASSKEILDQLAVARHGDRDTGAPINRLRSALSELFPDHQAGELPTPAQLSAKLSTLCDHAVGGVAIVRGPRSNKGLRWSVRRV